MSSTDDSQSPRDIANHAEGLVVALPQTILSLLFRVGVAQETGDSVSARVTQIQEANHYLRDQFAEAFAAAVEAPLSEALEGGRSALQTAVEEVGAGLPAPNDDPNSDALLSLAAQTEETIAPAVGAFLGAMFDQVVAHEKSQTKRAQEIDASALDQIDSISRKVNFIAINASVEAARVGEVGKGFAVIANEIKDLSEQAKAAVSRMRDEFA